MKMIKTPFSAVFLLLFAEVLTQDASSNPTENGLIFDTYYSWSSDVKGRLKHLPGFPGYDNITGEDTGSDDAIKPSVPTYLFKNEDTKMQSMAADVREKVIYMHDDFTRSIAYVTDYNAKLENITINYADISTSKATLQLAVDWLSHTVYWADTNYRRIMAIPGQPEKIKMGYYKIIIEDSIGVPMGIAVDPHEGLLFWTDVGKEPKIERVSLDGNPSSRMNFNFTHKTNPTCLALDRKAKKIYWIENSIDKILFMTYTGQNKTVLKAMSRVTFYDMALFRDVVYISDIYDGYLYTLNTTKESLGKMESNIITYYPHDIFGIAVYSEEAQPLRDRDYCAILNCDQFCITTKESAKCACAEGYEFNTSSGKCEADKKYMNKAIVFANATHICMTDVQALSSEKVKNFCIFSVIKQYKAPPVPVNRRKRQVDSSTPATTKIASSAAPVNGSTSPPVTHTETKPPTTTSPPPTTTTMAPTAAPGDIIKMFDMDMKKRTLFIVTTDNSIYKRPIDVPIENEEKELVTKASGNISGIAFDPVDSKNLYWCEYDTNSIWLINMEDNSVKRVNPENDTRIIHPRNLIVLLKERKLVMISGDGEKLYSLIAMTLDGQNTDVIVSGKNEITDFYYNPEEQRYYYQRNSYIYKASPDGKIDSVEHYGVNVRSYLIFNYQNFIVWIYYNETHGNVVQTRNTHTGVNINLLSFDTSKLVDIKPLDEKLQRTDLISPCRYNNGNCSQICITHFIDSKLKRMCECSFGYTVENEVNCTTNVVDDNFLLFTEWSVEKIMQIDNFTHEIHVVPGDEDAEYMGIYFDPKKKRVIWAHYFEELVYSANINGSDRQILADLGNSGYAYRFDQDAMSGNFYFTSYFDTYLGVITPDGQYTILNDDFGWDSLLDISIYPIKGWMYYTVDGYPSYVGRANMDGTNHEVLISGDHVRYPDGLAINHLTDRLYWSDATFDTIQDCNMDGKNCITIVNMTAASIREEIRDIVTDGYYLYYSTYRKDHVVRVGLKKPYTRTPVGQNFALGKIDTMTLYSSTNINIQKANPLCEANGGLGDCSTICLPTATGRTCACEDGVNLKADERTCDNIYQCDILIEQTVTLTTGEKTSIDITMDKSCTRFLHNKCNYQCPNNYEPLFDTEMTCTNAGWSMESRILCKEVRCPTTVDNGKIVGDCKREVGDKCDYQCDIGFVKTRELAVCTKTGQYHTPKEEFCEPFKCSVSIANGVMDKDCTRVNGSSCDYLCNKFYTQNPKYPKAQCQSNGWSPDPSSLCLESTCPADSLSNGQLSPSCLGKIGDACTYSCKQGYVKTTQLAFCKNDYVWHPEDACSAYMCDDKIENGVLDSGCSRVVGTTCSYSCNKFYDPADKKALATCGPTGWTPTDLCRESVCDDSSLSNGKVPGTCSKKIGEDCQFECNQGYVNITDKAFCRNDKKWHPSDACSEFRCSDTIENGALDKGCSRVVGSSCNYTCAKHNNASTGQATCTVNGWNPSADLCQAVSCPSTVPNGRISATCDLTVGSTCDYKCKSGYVATEVHPNVTCKRTGQWVTDNLCLVPQKSKSDALSVPAVSVGFSVLGIVVIILIIAVICIVWRRKKSSSKYSNFDDSSSVAIENPGYRQRTSFPSASMEDPNYTEVDVSQMKPVTTTSFSSGVLDDGNL